MTVRASAAALVCCVAFLTSGCAALQGSPAPTRPGNLPFPIATSESPSAGPAKSSARPAPSRSASARPSGPALVAVKDAAPAYCSSLVSPATFNRKNEGKSVEVAELIPYANEIEYASRQAPENLQGYLLAVSRVSRALAAGQRPDSRDYETSVSGMQEAEAAIKADCGFTLGAY